ncbi:hypothetical protein PT047_08910, partial [Erysipelothrix rhusiopathiae]|nr:hypothetical protein [Erysipelothrix rhusiopathiae]
RTAFANGISVTISPIGSNTLKSCGCETKQTIFPVVKSTAGIACEGWMPIARNKVADSNAVLALADKYHKTAAQITLRWQIQ